MRVSPCAAIANHPCDTTKAFAQTLVTTKRELITPHLLSSQGRFATRAPDSAYQLRRRTCLVQISRRSHLTVHASENESKTQEEPPVVYNKEFGYSRKDVLIIGVLTIAAGYGFYYGLQFFGMDELQAGATSQLIIFVAVLFTWVLTYLFRVGTKTTTYVTQLQEYEEAVMQKRLDEMTDAEIEVLMDEVEREKQEIREQLKQERNRN